MRLSVLYRRPLAEILAWPARHIELILAFLQVEPSPEDRLEQAIARLTWQHFNRTRGKDDEAKPLADFLPFATAWADTSPAPSDLDSQLTARLAQLGKE